MNYSRKKTKQGGWGGGGGGGEGRGHTFLNSPSSGRVLTLLLEIPGKTRLHPWKIHQIGLFQKKKQQGFRNSGKGLGDQKFYLGGFFTR